MSAVFLILFCLFYSYLYMYEKERTEQNQMIGFSFSGKVVVLRNHHLISHYRVGKVEVDANLTNILHSLIDDTIVSLLQLISLQ